MSKPILLVAVENGRGGFDFVPVAEFLSKVGPVNFNGRNGREYKLTGTPSGGAVLYAEQKS